jgi:hypothetical protein
MATPTDAPANLKVIQPYLKIASEHDQRDMIVGNVCNKNNYKKNLLP